MHANEVLEISEVREKGGIRPIVNMLNSPNEMLQANAAKALSILSSDGTFYNCKLLYILFINTVLLAASKDAIRNCGAIPDIFSALSTTQTDRIKGLLLGSLLHLISCGMHYHF